jgi:hypothetical protein
LDEDQLLGAMIQLAQSPELRRQMGEAGRAYTGSECHPAKVAEAYASGLRFILAFYRRRYG